MVTISLSLSRGAAPQKIRPPPGSEKIKFFTPAGRGRDEKESEGIWWLWQDNIFQSTFSSWRSNIKSWKKTIVFVKALLVAFYFSTYEIYSQRFRRLPIVRPLIFSQLLFWVPQSDNFVGGLYRSRSQICTGTRKWMCWVSYLFVDLNFSIGHLHRGLFHLFSLGVYLFIFLLWFEITARLQSLVGLSAPVIAGPTFTCQAQFHFTHCQYGRTGFDSFFAPVPSFGGQNSRSSMLDQVCTRQS